MLPFLAPVNSFALPGPGLFPTSCCRDLIARHFKSVAYGSVGSLPKEAPYDQR